MAAAPAVVSALRLDPARPTRTMPVLVTGPFPAAAIPGVADVAGPPIAIAPPLAVGAAGLAVVAFVPPIAALLVATGGLAAPWFIAPDEVGGVVAGCVVGGAPAEPETVMFTDGLPVPQSAVTVYVPEAPGSMVAVPEKLIELCVTEADPLTKAEECTPPKAMPLFGQVPRMLTLCPGAAVPGFTIS